MIHFVFTLIGQPGLTRVIQRVVAVAGEDDVQQLGKSTDKLIGGTMTALKYAHLSVLVYSPLVSAMSDMQAFRSGATCGLCCLLFANAYCGRELPSRSVTYPTIQARICDGFCADAYVVEWLTLLIAGVDLQPLLVERVVSGASVLVKKIWVPPQLWATGHSAVGGIFDKAVLNIQKVTSSKKTGHRKCRPQVSPKAFRN